MAKMSYQEARGIRNMPSLSEMMTQNMMSGQSVGKSIRGALGEKFNVSKRLKARAVGIKEKFDPLNIARFMTGGSKLAPTMLGNLLGRSQEDIEYFGGRARPVASATKIGKLEQTDSLNDILKKIYTFMKKTQESDVRTRELSNNFKEEKLQEDEKKHKELLEAIKKLTTDKTVKSTKVEKVEKDTGVDILGIIGDILNAFGAGKNALGLLERIGTFFKNPLGAAILGFTAASALLLYLLANDEKPEETTKAIINAGATDGGLPEAIMEASKDVVQSRKNRILSERTGDEKSIFNPFKDSDLQKEYLKKIGWDEKTATTKADREKGIIGFDDEGQPIYKKKETPSASPVTPAKPAPQSNVGGADNVTAEQTTTPTAAPAIPESAPNIGQKLSQVTGENSQMKMFEGLSDAVGGLINNVINNTVPKSPPNKNPIPPVRNQEETFQRMILNSTRVV